MAIDFVNPLTAGTVLVREDIRSQNYVPGVSGWIVEADGDAEFNDVTIRGGVVVSGTALYYDGAPGPGTLFLAIAAAAGVDAYGNTYDAGLTMGKNGVRQVRLTYDLEGGYLDLPFNDVNELTTGHVVMRRSLSGTPQQQLFLQLATATQTVAGGTCAVRLQSASVDGTRPARFEVFTDPGGVTDSVLTSNHHQTQILPSTASGNSVLYVQGPPAHAGNLLRVSDNGTDRLVLLPDGTATLTGSLAVSGYATAQNLQSDSVSVSFVALSSSTVAVVFPTAYPVGVVPNVMTNINSGAGATARWGSRAINVNNTGFTLFVYKCDAADPAQTWANVPVQWFAHD